jgi:aldehyde dehydrogenase (NAD+)
MSELILKSQPKPRTKSTTTSSTNTVAPGSSNGSLDFGKLVADHRAYFLSGATRPVEWRESQLLALRSMLKDHAEDFYAALWSDLRRNRIEADLVDVKCTTSEIDHALAHLRHWMKPVSFRTPLQLAPSHGEVRFDPLGVGLIIGTWNYPVMLTLQPLVAAISAGNCAVIKPSEVSPATGEVIARYLPEYLDPKAFSVVLGAVPETTALLEQPWDHIFFTGGTTVAKIVMTAAAKNLTPVVLELGGKNPTIVHSSANLKVAARRIAFGRWVNCGQSCTAPDYVLVFKDVAVEFLKYLKETLVESMEKIRKTALISAGSSALIISIGWLGFSAVERFFTAVSMIATIASSRQRY